MFVYKVILFSNINFFIIKKIKKPLIGFEPMTLSLQVICSNQLSYNGFYKKITFELSRYINKKWVIQTHLYNI